ncbi:MAG: hypothetical protein WDA07_06315 [Leucobacter sp.]
MNDKVKAVIERAMAERPAHLATDLCNVIADLRLCEDRGGGWATAGFLQLPIAVAMRNLLAAVDGENHGQVSASAAEIIVMVIALATSVRVPIDEIISLMIEVVSRGKIGEETEQSEVSARINEILQKHDALMRKSDT